jgi:ATP:ADP antiporter, AAA family
MTRPMATTMLCAAAVMAQFVGGKAARDALFLTSLDFTALPAMLIAASVCSLLLVAVNGRGGRRLAPATLVPASFVASGVLFLCEWLLRSTSPTIAAVIVYLHISGAGPLLASGFWLIASERFDPRTAKKRFGQIAGAGTLGGLLSALIAERIAAVFGVPAMLPFLAALQFLSAWLVRRVALESVKGGRPAALDEGALDVLPARSGLRVIAEAPYLRNLAALVLLGTTGAALVDYLFKAQVLETFGRGDHLLRFFALYYAATSIITFIVQTSSSRAMLERFGLGATASTPSWALLAGSLAGLVAPGLGSLIAARGGESVFRSSLYRAGYELFYTPIPAAEKRAAKSLIDVAFDRLGDAFGGGLVRLVVVLLPAIQFPAILWLAIVCSVGAVVAASRLNRGYLGTLETSLVTRGGAVDLSVEDGLNRTLMRDIRNANVRDAAHRADSRVAGVRLDPDVQDILSLRSRHRDQVVAVLSRADGLAACLVPHAIPLLAWDAVADHAMFALRKVAEERVGQLADALIDPNQEFAVRRRLARVFAVCVSQRAADGLMLALDDLRFDVRCQAARSLACIVEKNPRVHIDSDRIFEVVLREAAVGRPVWESRRLLDGFANESPLDGFVRDRAGESLAHVFTLLSLVLQREPLQIAFRSLHTDDEHLQGTALEYLDGVLPAPIRQRLWPFLERRAVRRPARPREEVIANLLGSNHSIMLNVEDLRRQAASDSLAVAV